MFIEPVLVISGPRYVGRPRYVDDPELDGREECPLAEMKAACADPRGRGW